VKSKYGHLRCKMSQKSRLMSLKELAQYTLMKKCTIDNLLCLIGKQLPGMRDALRARIVPNSKTVLYEFTKKGLFSVTSYIVTDGAAKRITVLKRDRARYPTRPIKLYKSQFVPWQDCKKLEKHPWFSYERIRGVELPGLEYPPPGPN